jgi:hypothetical protein
MLNSWVVDVQGIVLLGGQHKVMLLDLHGSLYLHIDSDKAVVWQLDFHEHLVYALLEMERVADVWRVCLSSSTDVNELCHRLLCYHVLSRYGLYLVLVLGIFRLESDVQLRSSASKVHFKKEDEAVELSAD